MVLGCSIKTKVLPRSHGRQNNMNPQKRLRIDNINYLEKTTLELYFGW